MDFRRGLKIQPTDLLADEWWEQRGRLGLGHCKVDLLPAEVGKNVDRAGSLGRISSSVWDVLTVKCPLDIC